MTKEEISRYINNEYRNPEFLVKVTMPKRVIMIGHLLIEEQTEELMIENKWNLKVGNTLVPLDGNSFISLTKG